MSLYYIKYIPRFEIFLDVGATANYVFFPFYGGKGDRGDKGDSGALGPRVSVNLI